MKTQKNLFILTVFFSFVVSIFWSLLVLKNFTSNNPVLTQQKTETNVTKTITNMAELQSQVKNIISRLNPSVVNIIISKEVQTYKSDPFWFFYEPSGTVKKKIWWWSGFFVSKDWLILTNKHVVWDPQASYTIITSKNEEFEWKVLALDPTNDLAVVRAYKNWKEIKIENFAPLINDTKMAEVWDFVIAIWNALAEFQNTVTFWVISGLGRSIEAWNQWSGSSELLSWLIQTDTAINPGNSGWPLVNLDWKVVWINTAVAQWANWLGFAIPLSQKEVDYMIKSIEKYGKIKRPYLGIKYFSLDKNSAKTLWLSISSWDYISTDVWSMLQNWPAYSAGLAWWDIIVEVDWNKIWDWISTKDIIKNKFPGEKVKLKILRWTEEKYIDIILGEF